MPRAIWNGTVVAESDRCVVVEGNQYFPPGTVKPEHLRPSATHTTCPWKGVASYYDVVVNGEATVTPRGTTPSRRTRRRASRDTSRSGTA